MMRALDNLPSQLIHKNMSQLLVIPVACRSILSALLDASSVQLLGTAE